MKKGQARIIVVVLIILIILATIIILYNVVNLFIRGAVDEVSVDRYSTGINIFQADLDADASFVLLRVEKGARHIDVLKFVFYNEEGETHIVDRDPDGLGDLDVGMFGFTHDDVNTVDLSKIAVVPVFEGVIGFEADFDNYNDNRVFGSANDLNGRYCENSIQCTLDSAGGSLNELEQFKCDFYTENCNLNSGS